MTRSSPKTQHVRSEASNRDALLAAGRTDSGVQREVNEDRFHFDLARGLFVVIDGVGGQAAGGKAADVALSMLRERLERETGPVSDRIKEAITIANNEIHRLAAMRSEWEGMACVLTIAVVTDGKATFGHVGDTRLYKIRENRIEKITSDHSPVGEREDANELSEFEAMRHPRRNEVYRDVGSEPHESADPDFIDLDEIPFESDAALLLCTDGLTDLVDSSSIARTVRQLAGDPEAVVRALIDAANSAGGKDNVTVVYVEGKRFATSQSALAAGQPSRAAEPYPDGGTERPTATAHSAQWLTRSQLLSVAIGALLVAAITVGFDRIRAVLPWFHSPPVTAVFRATDAQVVRPTESIAAAIQEAAAGSEIIVEPGEYREQLILKDRIRLVSRLPRAASIRLPATAADAEAAAAVVAYGVSGAELVGFRIIGDSATPLAVGILVEDSAVSILDVEITGATRAGIEFSGGGPAALLGSDIGDNPGAAIIVRAGATPRVAHNAFMRNGMSERAPGTLVVEAGAAPVFYRNVFVGLSPDSFVTLDDAGRLALKSENWFVPLPALRTNRGSVPDPRERKR